MILRPSIVVFVHKDKKKKKTRIKDAELFNLFVFLNLAFSFSFCLLVFSLTHKTTFGLNNSVSPYYRTLAHFVGF